MAKKATYRPRKKQASKKARDAAKARNVKKFIQALLSSSRSGEE